MSLTHAQEIEFKEAFALFDPTNSGTIQPKAFADFLALLNDPALSASVKLPTQPLDYKAFCALMARKHKGAETSDEAYVTFFNAINKDGSGNVSSAELRSALQHFGNRSLNEHDADEIVREADVSGDGRISIEEFLKIMQKSGQKLRGEHVL
ncbi:calmodulin-like 3 [Linnemannia exigua]|uniref:Calmodulin-like 3 n=1 Tax=Linnemannia exigua TaxID=604196 RepID=A0AAD4H3R2_9FUNG|nr:calmodulin-like 3 [Linnemannia exigua]